MHATAAWANPASKAGIETFFTERYALFTATRRGDLARVNIHHLPWPLELAEAEFEVNDLPEAHGIRLPDTKPLLQYSRELTVYIWALESLGSASCAPRDSSGSSRTVTSKTAIG